MRSEASERALDPLLEHAPFVRRLARALVRDAARADDLVQDAWMAAMRRPPQERGGPRAWLAAVVRRRAIDLAKEDARRSSRERAAARRETQPPSDVEERAELAARVLAAVRALHEPYREAIWRRYYEDEPPRAIAKALGVPVATVETRLRRGREQLRAALAAELGGDARRIEAFLALAGLARPQAIGLASALKLAAAVAAIPLVAVAGRVAFAPSALAPVQPLVDAHPAERVAPRADVEARARASDRVPDGGARAAHDATRTADRSAVVTGRVLARTKQPVCVGLVRRDEREAQLLDDGVYTPGASFELTVPDAGLADLVLASEGCTPLTLALSLEGGERKDVGAIELFEGARFDGFVRDVDGRPLPRADVVAEREERSPDDPELSLGAHRLVFERGAFRVARAKTRCDDEGRFDIRGLESGSYLVGATPEMETPKGVSVVMSTLEQRESLQPLVVPARNVELVVRETRAFVRIVGEDGPLDACTIAMDEWSTLLDAASGADSARRVTTVSLPAAKDMLLRYRTSEDFGLWVRRPGYRAQLVRLATAARDADERITIVLPSLHENARVLLRVDCEGEPTPRELRITLHPVSGRELYPAASIERVLALEDGRAWLEDVPNGEYELEVEAQDAPLLQPRRVRLDVDRRESTLDLSLELGGAIELLPRRDLGSVGDWSFRASDERGSSIELRVRDALTELGEGKPRVLRPALAPGTWKLELRHLADRREVRVTIRAGRVARVFPKP